MQGLPQQTAAMAAEYPRELPDRRGKPSEEAVAALASLQEPMPDGPTAAKVVLERLHRGCGA